MDACCTAASAILGMTPEELIASLWFAQDMDMIAPLIQVLVSNFWRLLADEGIEIRDYQSVAALPV